ncbi:MAG TPA: hypothetical protein VFJ16_31180 [Longimicrobium sp.]|nr:hypothetical protein [Longimicrobium sp.]
MKIARVDPAPALARLKSGRRALGPTSSSDRDAHALAALAPNDHPFGFTIADVEFLNTLADLSARLLAVLARPTSRLR